ncbi:unnamed protein product [Schistosoma margrebowiei]|uniref:Uncharacterized protein n=1 Tax=Schistosoma margrebowiei TaxID=48269 RepID=A0A183LSY5_9TREM|nr:unnamed protein product [Schistosoma margrebowiei]
MKLIISGNDSRLKCVMRESDLIHMKREGKEKQCIDNNNNNDTDDNHSGKDNNNHINNNNNNSNNNNKYGT